MENYLGKEIPKLGFGLMRLPMLDGEIDVEQLKKMVDLFLSKGFKYFDTSIGYGNSEIAIKEALVDRYPRENYIFATKVPAWAAKNKKDAQQMFYSSLERTGAGYFDFYLLHNMGEGRTKFFDEYEIWDFLNERKKEGLIRHLGFSFHDKADKLDKILNEHPETEFVQLQINYADWENPMIESKLCYEVARKHGKPVVVMEPVKGGTLASPPPVIEEIFKNADKDASLPSWAIRYAASLEGIITVLSGMSDLEQMKNNISYMENFKPLNEKEYEVINKAQELLSKIPSIPCTACEYCMKGCPKSIAIPGILKSMNVINVYDDRYSAKRSYAWNTKGCNLNVASACIGCGQCESVCPQHIKVIDELKKAAELFE